MCSWVTKQTLHLFIGPAGGLVRVLMQVVPASIELDSVKPNGKTEMQSSLSLASSSIIRVHLWVVPADVKLAEGSALRKADEPGRLALFD